MTDPIEANSHTLPMAQTLSLHRRSATPLPSKSRTTIFTDANEIKDNLREQVEQRYDVSNFYHATGFTQWIARHPRFELVTRVVIGLNTLWIWIDTDFNPGGMLLLASPPLFQVAEHAFCGYFMFEWSMRFCAFQAKCNALRDHWFVFDSFLALSMVLETWFLTAVFLALTDGSGVALGNVWILRIARLLRLLRMARMARILRTMPELLILIRGMAGALRSVAYAIALLALILYIFGIAFVQVCFDTECEVLFPDVPRTMHSLLLNVALTDELPTLMQPLQEQSLFLMFMLYVFVFIACLGLLNLLVGVICEVVSATASHERAALNLNIVRDKIEELMGAGAHADSDGDGMISKNEFRQLLTNEKAVSILQDIGVDVVGLVDFADTIFLAGPGQGTGSSILEVEEKTLTFDEFMGLVLELRGGNNATVRDILNMRKDIDERFSRLEDKLSKVHFRNSEVFGSFEARISALKPEREVEAKPLGPGQAKSEAQSFDFFQRMRNLLTFHESEVAVMRTENRLFHEQTVRGLSSETQHRDAQPPRSWEEAEELMVCRMPDTVISAVSPTRIAPDGVSNKPMVTLLPSPVPKVVSNQCEELSNSTASPRWPEFEFSVPLEAAMMVPRTGETLR